MLPSNVNVYKLNYYLSRLAKNSCVLLRQNGNAILIQQSLTKKYSLEERVRGVVNYLASESQAIRPIHSKFIRKIHKNFSDEAQHQTEQVQKTVKPFLDVLVKIASDPTKVGMTQIAHPLSVCEQISPRPRCLEEFISNLELVVKHFPRYQLHKDLSVFDSIFHSVPNDWNFDVLHRNLLKEFEIYETSGGDAAATLLSLKEQIIPLLKIPKPIQVGITIETSPMHTDNPVMLIDVVNLIRKGVPCVVNRHFFQAHEKNFELFPKLNIRNDVDLYIQNNRDVCVIVPKDMPLEEYGFNSKALELSKGEHLEPAKLPLDLPSIFINENEKLRFFRLVSFSGHGNYPGTSDGLNQEIQGIIAGIPIRDFQKILSDLKDLNTAYMLLCSCYSGGTNSADIHQLDETVSFPIHITSSFDVPSLEIYRQGEEIAYNEGYDRTKVLDHIQKLLFPELARRNPWQILPRQLTQKDRETLSRVMDYPFLGSKFANLGTLILPANRSEIPKVAYSLANSGEILDVSRAYQKKRSTLNYHLERGDLLDTCMERKGYLFTDPIVPFSLKATGKMPMILLSQGGNQHHVIQEINTPQQDLEDIARDTFNAFHGLTDELFLQPAYKVFFIGTWKCRYEGRGVCLKNVMLKNTQKVREVLFQLEGDEKFRKLSFKIGNSTLHPWYLEETTWIDFDQGVREVYLSASESTPSNKTLRQMTAGKQSQEDFIEALDSIFFSKPVPKAAKLYSAILRSLHQDTNKGLLLRNTLKELQHKLHPERLNEINMLFKEGVQFAEALKLFDLSNIINEFSYTPLMKAIVAGNLQEVQSLINENPALMKDVNSRGSTPLLIAMDRKQFEIARWLVAQGADLNSCNALYHTPFSLLCAGGQPEVIQEFSAFQQDIKGEQGAKALVAALHAKNWPNAHFLVDRLAGSEAGFEKYPLIALAVRFASSTDILSKLLNYPHIDINQPLREKQDTAVHMCVYNGDVESLKWLLKRGGNPNLVNAHQYSPLHLVVVHGKEKGLDLAKALLEAGADINIQDGAGLTALHWAILYQNRTLIEFFIKRGAALQAETQRKINTLELAADLPGLLQFILEIPGLAINPRACRLDRIFVKALENENLRLAKLMLLHGVNINQTFEKGELPWMYYLRQKRKDTDPIPVIDFFLDNGADLTLQDSQGDSIMHWVMKEQDLNLYRHLKAAQIPVNNPVNLQGDTPWVLGFKNPPQNLHFLLELLKDKKLTHEHVPVILKMSLEKWGLSHSRGVGLMLHEILTIFLNTKDRLKTDPRTKFYEQLFITGMILSAGRHEFLDSQVDILKKWIHWFKQFPDSRIDAFYNLPVLQAALYLNLDSNDKTREFIFSLVEHFPECIQEQCIDLSTHLTSDLSILKKMIQKGAELASKPLLSNCDLEMLKVLEARGVDLSGEVGLHYLDRFLASDYPYADQDEGVEYLLSRVRYNLHQVLSSALLNDAKEDFIKRLINHPHINLQATDDPLGSALYWALRKANLPAIQGLLSKRAIFIPYKKCSALFKNPINHVISCANEDNTSCCLEALRLLMNSDYKKSLNEKSEVDGLTPLIYATMSMQEVLLKYLLAQGAKVNDKIDRNQRTALHVAININALKLAAMLINHGADVNSIDDKGNTALHDAIRLTREKNENLQLLSFIALLTQKGAKWDLPNKEGVTPKDLAIKLRLCKVLPKNTHKL